jgi:hypothetical protein
MSPADPDGASTIKTTDTNDNDDDSSSSDSSVSSGDSSDSADDPEKAKAALRAKIRKQAGSLLSTKSDSAGVLASTSKSRLVRAEDDPIQGKRSSFRNIAPAAAVVGAGAATGAAVEVVAMIGNDPSEDSSSLTPRAGEQQRKESEKRPALIDGEYWGSSDSFSKRSVRFEADDGTFDDKEKEAPPDDDKVNTTKPARPSLAAPSSTDLDDDEETGKVLGATADPEADEDFKEQIVCGVGFRTGAILFAITLLVWGIALPIALVNRDQRAADAPEATDAPEEDTLLPTSNNATIVPTDALFNVTDVPTMAPTVQPALLIDFPLYTLEAIATPTSPQAMAFQWMFTDPLVHTYDVARQSQRFALAALYYATEGGNWTKKNNWLSVDGMHECFWYTATPVCNDQQQYTALDLNENNIHGELPPEISMLSALREIHLHGNRINGSIPVSLSELTQLNVLDLQKNRLTGPFPSQLGLLTSLQLLWLNETRDTSATTPAVTIPTELGLLTNLTELHLSSSKLNGSIPTELAMLSNLNWLALRHNELSGGIPSELPLMHKLIWLDLAENNLVDSIPANVGLLNSTLRFLQLEFNNLNGTIPDSMGRLTNVQEMWLQENMLTGSVPPTLCYFQRIGKVGSIWVDCDQVSCSCCLCVDDNVDDGNDVDEGDSNASILAGYGASPASNMATSSNTTDTAAGANTADIDTTASANATEMVASANTTGTAGSANTTDTTASANTTTATAV